MRKKISAIMLLMMLLMLSLNSFAFGEEMIVNDDNSTSNLVENTGVIPKVSFEKSNEINYSSDGGKTILDVDGLGKVQFDCYAVAIIDGKAQKVPVPTLITIKKVYKEPDAESSSNNAELFSNSLTYVTTYELEANPYTNYYDDAVTAHTEASIEVYKDTNNDFFYDLNRAAYWLIRNIYELNVQNAKIRAVQYGLNIDNTLEADEYISPSMDSLWDNSNDLEGHHYVRTESGTFSNWRPAKYFKDNVICVQWYQGDIYYDNNNTGLDISRQGINCPM